MIKQLLRMQQSTVYILVALSAASIVSMWMIDKTVLSYCIDLPDEIIDPPWVKAFKQLGKGWVCVWLLFLVGILRPRIALLGLLALGVVAVLVLPLKAAVPRYRPEQRIAIEKGEPQSSGRGIILGRSSFPSGDTATATAFAVTLAIGAPKIFKVLLVIMAVAIGVMRVAHLRHYPSDVLAGLALGILAVVIAGNLAKKILSPRDSELPPWFQPFCGFAVVFMLATGFTMRWPSQVAVFARSYGFVVAAIYAAYLVKLGLGRTPAAAAVVEEGPSSGQLPSGFALRVSSRPQKSEESPESEVIEDRDDCHVI